MLNVFFLHKDSFILLIIMSKQTDLTNAPNSNKESALDHAISIKKIDVFFCSKFYLLAAQTKQLSFITLVSR